MFWLYDLDLEDSNTIASHDTPAYDNVSLYKSGYKRVSISEDSIWPNMTSVWHWVQSYLDLRVIGKSHECRANLWHGVGQCFLHSLLLPSTNASNVRQQVDYVGSEEKKQQKKYTISTNVHMAGLMHKNGKCLHDVTLIPFNSLVTSHEKGTTVTKPGMKRGPRSLNLAWKGTAYWRPSSSLKQHVREEQQ